MRETVDRANDARDHDEWFRSEVERAVIEADDSATTPVDHAEVLTTWQQQRAEFERRAAGRIA